MIAKDAWGMSVRGLFFKIEDRAESGNFDCFIGVWEKGLPEQLRNRLFEEGYDVRGEGDGHFYVDWRYAVNEKSK